MSNEVRKVPPETGTYDYDVCLSFAGEDGDYVAKVAAALKNARLRVFYHEDDEADLLGTNLYQGLADIYQNRCRFCVVFASKAYAVKSWTMHELEAAQARDLKSRDYLLVGRFDDTELPGVLRTESFKDLRSTGPEKFADLIIRKVRKRPRVKPDVPSQDAPPQDVPQLLDEKPCRSCGQMIPRAARICPKPNCNEAQDWRRFLPTRWTIGLLTAIVALLVSVYPAANWITRHYGDSRTSFHFVNADENTVYIHVSNNGSKRSRLIDYTLKFNDLPVEAARLHPIVEDASKGSIAAGDEVDLRLTVSGLSGKCNPATSSRFTNREIEPLIGDKKVTLVIGVEESNHPPGRFASQSEEVPANRIKDFIMKWVPKHVPRRKC